MLRLLSKSVIQPIGYPQEDILLSPVIQDIL
jgi:hypothetical protein